MRSTRAACAPQDIAANRIRGKHHAHGPERSALGTKRRLRPEMSEVQISRPDVAARIGKFGYI